MFDYQSSLIGSSGGSRPLSQKVISHHEPNGLKNLGNTCFLNSVMQGLVHCSSFYSNILLSKHRVTCTNSDCVQCAIENCTVDMCRSATSTNPTTKLINLLGVISNDTLAFGRQEDAHEFLISLIMSAKQFDFSSLAQLFQGSLLSRVCCYNCRSISSKEDPFVDISLDISKSSSLSNAFAEYCE